MDRKAIKIIRLFLKKLKKDFNIDRVIFFGSRTKGDYLQHSDIDLVIVSKDFDRIDFTKRMSMMYDYWNFDYDVDFICYTPEEFQRLSQMITLAREAAEHGINIISSE